MAAKNATSGKREETRGLKVGRLTVQARNTSTGNFIARSAKGGKFTVKQDGTPFKGVRVVGEATGAPSDRSTRQKKAEAAERAVLEYLNETAQN